MKRGTHVSMQKIINNKIFPASKRSTPVSMPLSKKTNLWASKRSQITIFIILAILIVGSIVVYFAVRKGLEVEIPQNMRPVYDYYLSCLEEHARQGISLLGEQGGYIEPPDFVPGSQYMPFSSQLDFFGQPIPYWMYVSGNNLLKEQVPTKSGMQRELGKYVKERLSDCDFTDFEMQGFDVFIEEGDVDADINDLNVDLNAGNGVTIYFEDQSVFVNNHEISVDSKLGKFYKLALNVYNFEKKNMFLEKYALDVLRLYAPVTGVEISCSPKVFVDEKIREDLVNAMAMNIGMLKLEGNYYDLRNKKNSYFVTDIGRSVDENVNFIYSPLWPSRIEIYGDRIVEPVGMQQGMGLLGFCYVPYHLVYDIDFPVLIQFYDSQEVFQFPIAVVIDKNQAREALPSIAGTLIESEVCEYKNQDVLVYTYDSELNPVEADIKFKCLNTECRIGKTEMQGGEAILDALFPSCVNGFILADAEGYAQAKYQISTNEENIANVILNRLYSVSVDVNSGSKNMAVVSFDSEDYSTSVLYPDMKDVQLIEGYYNVSVYIYKNSSLKFPATSTRKCVSVPRGGIGSLFGLEEEKCFDINLPEQEINFVVIGGGKTADYFTEEMLRESEGLNIVAPVFKTPASLQEVQDNYLELEDAIVEVEL